jgi:hypothetical protein
MQKAGSGIPRVGFNILACSQVDAIDRLWAKWREDTGSGGGHAEEMQSIKKMRFQLLRIASAALHIHRPTCMNLLFIIPGFYNSRRRNDSK